MTASPHNIPLGGRTGPERLGGEAASGEPKTLVGAPPAENQHISPETLAQWRENGLGQVVDVINGLQEQLEIQNEVSLQHEASAARLGLENHKLKEQYAAATCERDQFRADAEHFHEQFEALREAMLYDWRMNKVDDLDYETPDGWALESHPWFSLLGLTVDECITMLRGRSNPASRPDYPCDCRPDEYCASDQCHGAVPDPASEPDS